jgi:glycine cleavage system H lipoate-binding protein
MDPTLAIEPFATKGAEYLWVILFLAALVAFTRALLGRVRPAPGLPYAALAASAPSRWFDLPGEVYYHPGHGWALPEGGDVVRIGVDDFAQKLLGRPNAIGLPEVGARLEQGERGWRIEVDAEPFDLLAPVGGEVVARNEAVLRDPELINRDPYGEGWLLEVRGPKVTAGLRTLLRGDLARAWLSLAERALFERMPSEVGLVMQDGGIPVSGIARALSPREWERIAGEFLLTR